MEAENDTREAIRKDIRVEYERQRKIEQELWEQRQQKQCQTENWYTGSASSVNTDDRRRKLIADKMSVHLVRTQGSGSNHRNNPMEVDKECREGPAQLVQHVSSPVSRQPIKKRKVRIASPHSVVADFIATTDAMKSPQQWNYMSSLMDSAFDDDNDPYDDIQDNDDHNDHDDHNDDDDGGMPVEHETSSLVDVPLQWFLSTHNTFILCSKLLFLIS